jgi:hypothetical protein
LVLYGATLDNDTAFENLNRKNEGYRVIDGLIVCDSFVSGYITKTEKNNKFGKRYKYSLFIFVVVWRYGRPRHYNTHQARRCKRFIQKKCCIGFGTESASKL